MNYNTCKSSEYKTFRDAKTKSLINFNLLAGGISNKANFPMKDLYSTAPSVGVFNVIKNIESDYEMGFLVGFETELMLPFNKYKWSVFTAPTYQQIKFKTSKDNADVIGNNDGLGTLHLNYDYSYFDIPIGLRHYFNLNNKSRLYLDAGYSFIFLTEKSEIRTFNPQQGQSVNLDNSYKSTASITSVKLGLGFNYNNKYSLSVNYHPTKKISNAEITGFSLIASYNLL